MTDRRRSLALIAASVVARAAAVLVLHSYEVPNSTYEHGEIAANLLAGRGFSIRLLGGEGPTSQQAPLYPLLVAASYWVGGVGTPRSLLILEIGQATVGGLLVAGILSLSREVAPSRPAWRYAAGAVAAFHPTLVYAATHVQVSLVAATLLTWTFASAYRVGRTGRTSDAAVAGLMLAASALADPILALAAPGTAWSIAIGAGLRASARPVAVMAVVAAAGVSPWIARNYRVHGEFVAIKDTFGYAFWQGNCALSRGTDKVVRASVEAALAAAPSGLRGANAALWAARHEAGCIDDIALTRADYAELGPLPEPERSRRLFRRAVAELGAEPGRYPRLCLSRLKAFVFFDETNPKSRNRIYRAGHLALTLAAVVGLAAMPGSLRRRLGPTVLTAALIAAFHALTIVSARFHVPIEPLMGLWAAGLLTGWDRGRAA